MDDDPFAALADEAALAEAVRERAVARSLARQAGEDATLVGTLLDLAESGVAVGIRTRDGGLRRGPIRSVAADFVVVDAGAPAWVRVAAITAVRPEPGRRAAPASGDRASASTRLHEALGDAAADQPLVTLGVAGSERVRGVLLAAGADVVTIALEDRSVVYVAVDAVVDVVFTG